MGFQGFSQTFGIRTLTCQALTHHNAHWVIGTRVTLKNHLKPTVTSPVMGWCPKENSHLFRYPLMTGEATNGSILARSSDVSPCCTRNAFCRN